MVCTIFQETLFIITILYLYICFREVFKAREKKTSKKIVAMKKVLMDNEKEGVSNILLTVIL